MRKTRRNIARKSKNQLYRERRTLMEPTPETEPFASAKGHTIHSESTKPPEPVQSHLQAGRSESRDPGAIRTCGASGAMSLSPTGVSVDSPGRSEHSERQPGEEIASEARPPQPPLAQNAPGAKVNAPLPELHHRATNAQDGFVPSSTQMNPLPASASSAAPRASQFETTTDRTTRNRQNAQHSTGPRTDAGKAASSRNALRHGLSIQRHAILPGEDPAAYQRLVTDLREIYEPQSRREDLAVEDIAQCRWAFQRFDLAEATALHRQTSSYTDDPEFPCSAGEALGYCAVTNFERDRDGNKHVEPDTDYITFERIQRYRAHWDRRHHRALAEFDRAQRARRADAAEERKQAEERRRQELHELKISRAKARLAEANAKTAANQSKAKEEAFFHALEQHLQAPSDFTEEDLATVGFVPQTSYEPPASQDTNGGLHATIASSR